MVKRKLEWEFPGLRGGGNREMMVKECKHLLNYMDVFLISPVVCSKFNIWCKNGYIQIDKNIFINPAWDKWMLLIANHVSCAKTRKELDLGSEHVNSRVSLLTTLSRCMDGRLPKEWKGGSLRNGRAPASDLESTYSTEEIICIFFFFFFLFQCLYVESTTDSFNQW